MKARTPKQTALDVIGRLPDDATVEDILYELYFLEKIDHGLKQADERDLTPHSEVMKEARAWLKSATQRTRGMTSSR